MASHAQTWFNPKLLNAVLHLLVWSLLTYLLFMYPPLIRSGAKLPEHFQLKQIVHMIMMIGAYYVNSFYLIPKLLLKGRMALFAFYIVLILAFSGLFMARLEIWLDLVEKLTHSVTRKIWHNTYIDFFGLFTTMFVLGISTSSSIIQRWNREWKIRQELETQRAVTELAYLRAQINPHFFFNTLNTIYSLTYSDADSSRKVLLKLSAMMRYLLYETKNDVTDVQHEMDFLCNYIDIMTLRLNKRTTVHVKLPTKLTQMPIAPMLLLPFIENAFKHGVDDVRPGLINVIIEQDNNGIRLHVENDIFCLNSTEETDENGIGLANTRRRLDLLYDGKYDLKVNDDSSLGKYQVNLTIALL